VIKRHELASRLGEVLRDARELAGMTQAEVASRLGLKGRKAGVTISQYELGANLPSFPRLVELAAIYGASPGSMLDESLRPKQAGPMTLGDALELAAWDVANSPEWLRSIYRRNDALEKVRARRLVESAAEGVTTPGGFDTPLDYETMARPLDVAASPTPATPARTPGEEGE